MTYGEIQMIEYWDLYDKNREKLGRTHERGKPLEEGTYHIAVNVWIVNSKGEVLLAKRHPQKKIYGGMWECSASGSIYAGEDSHDGAIRETYEEIGLELERSELILIESIRRKDDFRDSFIVRKDIDIKEVKIQPEEVIDIKWARKEEYEKMVELEVVAPPTTNFYTLYNIEKDE